VRYDKIPRSTLDVKRLMSNKPLQQEFSCCSKKDAKKIETDEYIPHGHLIETVENEM